MRSALLKPASWSRGWVAALALIAACAGPAAETAGDADAGRPARTRVLGTVSNGGHRLAGLMPVLPREPGLEPGELLVLYRSDRSSRTLYATSNVVESEILLPVGEAGASAGKGEGAAGGGWGEAGGSHLGAGAGEESAAGPAHSLSGRGSAGDGSAAGRGAAGSAAGSESGAARRGADEASARGGVAADVSLAERVGAGGASGRAGAEGESGRSGAESRPGGLSRRTTAGLGGFRGAAGRPGTEWAVGPPGSGTVGGLAGLGGRGGEVSASSELPLLRVEEDVMPGTLLAGAPFTYRVRVTNASAFPLVLVTLQNRLPSRLRLTDANGLELAEGGVLRASLASDENRMRPGETREVSFTVTYDEGDEAAP